MILEYPLLHSNQRFELDDLKAIQSNVRTDSKYWQAGFNNSTSHIVQGFSISSAALGQSSLSVTLAGSVLLNPNNTTDFSWFAGATGSSPISVPVSVGNLVAGRNYLELQLGSVDGTPLQRVFWDPSANGGAGAEFSQSVNTTTELTVSVICNQSGFNSGNNNRLPLAIVDVSSSTNLVAGIIDQRNLFFRLGTGSQPTHTFTWGSQAEPATALTFNSASGLSYSVGETVTFTTGATAIVVTGGTQNITVNTFSGLGFALGDTVTGGTSGGSAVLLSYYESFSGADKDIATLKGSLDAIMTEIARVKGTTYWYQIGAEISLPALQDYVNAMLTSVSSIGKAQFYWSGTALSITDAATSAQAATDNIAAIRVPGRSGNLNLRRQDGTGTTSAITIASGSLLYVQLPSPLSTSTNYSGAGTGSTNYQVVTRAAFVPSSVAFVLCYNENGSLVFPNGTALLSGEYLYLDSSNGANKTLATSSSYSITNNDEYGFIEATAGASGITITLPTAATANKGREIVIKKIDSAVGAVTISGTVDGISSPAIYVQYGEVTIVSDGTSFYFKNKWPTLTAVSQVVVSGNVTLTNNAIHLVNTSSARTLTLPAPNVNTCIMIKDITGSANTNAITVARFASEKIETVAASYVLSTNLGCWTFISNGTDWFLTETGINWVAALVNPMTTTGDMIYGGSAGVANRVAIGINGQFLRAGSSIPGYGWYNQKSVSSANYTILDTDGFDSFLVSTGGSNRTITLPNPANNVGRKLFIQRIDTGAGQVLIARHGSEKIQGSTCDNALNSPFAYIELYTDGTDWYVCKVWDYHDSGASSLISQGASNAWTQINATAIEPGFWKIEAEVNFRKGDNSSSPVGANDFALSTTSASAGTFTDSDGFNSVAIDIANIATMQSNGSTSCFITVSTTGVTWYLNGNSVYTGTAPKWQGTIRAVRIN